MINIIFMIFSVPLVLAMEIDEHDINSQQDLNLAVLAEFKKIVADYDERLNDAQTKPKNEAIKILEKGFWYASDYFDLLTKYDQNKRLSWLKEKDAFIHGFSHSCDLVSSKETSQKGHYYLNAQPSKVLHDFGDKLIFIDCAIAYELAYYRAMLSMLGENKFNKFINNHLNNDLAFFSYHMDKTFLALVTNSVKFTNIPGEIGSNYYFFNHPLFSFKHHHNHFSGIHVIVLDDNNDVKRFIGLGLPPKGLTAQEIETLLVNKFNEYPYNDKILELIILNEGYTKVLLRNLIYMILISSSL